MMYLMFSSIFFTSKYKNNPLPCDLVIYFKHYDDELGWVCIQPHAKNYYQYYEKECILIVSYMTQQINMHFSVVLEYFTFSPLIYKTLD